jgi:hypothetical protein
LCELERLALIPAQLCLRGSQLLRSFASRLFQRYANSKLGGAIIKKFPKKFIQPTHQNPLLLQVVKIRQICGQSNATPRRKSLRQAGVYTSRDVFRVLNLHFDPIKSRGSVTARRGPRGLADRQCQTSTRRLKSEAPIDWASLHRWRAASQCAGFCSGDRSASQRR